MSEALESLVKEGTTASSAPNQSAELDSQGVQAALDVLGNAGLGRQRLGLPFRQRGVVVDLGEAVKRGQGSLQVAKAGERGVVLDIYGAMHLHAMHRGVGYGASGGSRSTGRLPRLESSGLSWM